MKLLEYEAKRLLRTYDIPTPDGVLVTSADDMPALPRILKVQVPVGGRGKAGGVVLLDDESLVSSTIDRLMGLSIDGYTPTAILAEQPLSIDRELYLALRVSRETAAIEVLAYPDGGVEIEQHADASLYRSTIRPDTTDTVTAELARHLDISEHEADLKLILQNLLSCLTDQDATLLEINPLVLTSDDELVAADCKLELDDAASFRHSEWDFEAKPADANFVTLDPDGTVATIANGAGLAMATVDAVRASGHTPANFLDIGGNATVESISNSFAKIRDIPSVQSIIINIFGGIVQCDTVALAIIAARDSFTDLPDLAIRLSGTRSSEARALLADKSIPLYDSLDQALESLK